MATPLDNHFTVLARQASATITPGTFVTLNADDKWVPGIVDDSIFGVVPDKKVGNGDYAENDTISAFIPQRGAQFTGRVLSTAAIAIGERLSMGANGILQKSGSPAGDPIVAIALEASSVAAGSKELRLIAV